MKKINFLCLALLAIPLLAADDRYVEVMTKAIGQVYQAKTNEETLQAVNTLDRIATAEKTKWEPYYYAAFGYVMMASRESDGSKKDALLDRSASYLEKAAALRPNDSEIITMEGFVSTIRLTVDPATRGPQYSMASMQAFGKALAINPENPRAMALKAQMQYGTAKFFSASTEEACATAKKASELFASSKPSTDPLAPAWGKGMVNDMLTICK